MRFLTSSTLCQARAKVRSELANSIKAVHLKLIDTKTTKNMPKTSNRLAGYD